ncbi:isocitrate/isopropylmalate dehydrogenase family protein [Phoenicibacter congonensis]|uniref:isocitrate/isopropylmalate dehydrogenase family protein n=1 Tax=Phoenicibacter congonensis TaxID=1944646 RepID=UPI0009A64B9F|nr:isocitrate/isopropylmalate dehydrogenase family protein [Phoenicibacter congonensis]
MKAVLIPGDGIGVEISESVKQVGNALCCDVEWEEYEAGAEYYEKTGKLMQDGLLDRVAELGCALKGPTATPIGSGFRSINVQLRQHFKTFSNLRPVHSLEGVKTRFDNVDIIIVRENTEDLYKGIEYMYDADTAHGIKLITRAASEKIARFAFDYAKKQGRKKVTCVHKANIMKLTDGMFLQTFEEVAKDYPEIDSDSVIVDALCMKLVTDPTQFDVLVAPNLYGDIISDLCAGLVGGLGFAPSANIGDDVVIYEAVHGSAPDIAGQGISNPTSLLLSFAMMLKDNGMQDKASKLEQAIFDVVKEGKKTTGDIGGSAKTVEFTQAIIERF